MFIRGYMIGNYKIRNCRHLLRADGPRRVISAYASYSALRTANDCRPSFEFVM